MVECKTASLWIIRIASAAVFLAICYELLEWLPTDDNPSEGMAGTIVLFFRLSANVIGFSCGLLISKLITITAQIIPAILWSGVVCAAYLVSKFSAPEINNLTALNYMLVVTFLSVPLVGGWAWAQTGIQRNNVASNLGVAK